MSEPSPAFTAAALREFTQRIFVAVGLPSSDAAAVAELMTEADLHGADGHGIFRLPQYVKRIEGGAVNVRPDIRVIRRKGASALVDGDNGMGHLVMRRAAVEAIARAREQGVGWVGVRMSNHAGPAALYARMVAAADMIGIYLAVGNANHLAPWGGTDLLLSTNPIAIAVPTESDPVVLDMATTVAAYGKVKTYAQQGKTMPSGWMIDRRGEALTDPQRAEEGLLLPLGGMEAGYKGYGLALMIGLLAGTLNGAAMGRDVIDFNADDRSVTNTGQAMVAVDPAAFGDPVQFRRAVAVVLEDLRRSARLPGVASVRVPGDRSAETARHRSVHGVPLPHALRNALDRLADRLAVPRL